MQVTLVAAMSADGKIAEHTDQSSLDWTSKEDTQFFIAKTKEAGTVIMGRKTFATFNRPLKGRRLIVLTKNPEAEALLPGVEFTSEAAAALLTRLAAEGVQAVVIGGGASVYGQFLQAGLVTELFLTIEPILFGGGVPLAMGFGRVPMKLLEVKQLNSQSVLLHYSL